MLFVLGAFLLSSVSARIFNVTIDDTLGDENTGLIPQYTPQDWISRSADGVPCKPCGAQPDGARVFKGTWHDKSTYVGDLPSTISLDFSGCRMYVFFVLFNNLVVVNKQTRLRFYLDGSSDAAGNFLHVSDPAGQQYLYGQLVFDSGLLPLGNHTLLVSSYSDGHTGSLTLFDYAVYTTDKGGPPQTTQIPAPSARRGRFANVAVTVGSIIAGAGGAAVLLGAGYLIYSRRQRRSRFELHRSVDLHAQTSAPEPFHAYRPAQSDTLSIKRGYREGMRKAPSISHRSLSSPEDSARLRSEVGWLREELERVRRIAEPPDYAHTSDDT